jgi:hypothetical protein
MSAPPPPVADLVTTLNDAGPDDRATVLDAIERVKRFLCGEGYRGEPGPTPTAVEVVPLMTGILYWAVRHSRQPSLPRLQALRDDLLTAQRDGRRVTLDGIPADGDLNLLKAELSGRPAPKTPIEVVAGGFRLPGGAVENLTGKPLAVLQALLAAPDYRLSGDDLRAMVWPDDCLTHPEQAVKDAAGGLRKALRLALRHRGVKNPRNPLPSTGRGVDLVYRLDLPALPQR